MARIRSQTEIVSSLLDFFRIAQPSLDTKPGTVSRDLFIESPSQIASKIYDEINKVSSLQSFRMAIGLDLDRLGANFGLTRNGGNASVTTALLTFNSLDSDIAINKNDIIKAKNGASFVTVNSTVVNSVYASQYKATASKYRADLDFIGITDQYAIEIAVQCSTTGVQGNISKYSLSSTNISGISHVTNLSPASGGSAPEGDDAFKNRILGIFGGANTGTAKGYEAAVKADPAVVDAIVIEPGDDLMTRDGTVVITTKTGTKKILSEGTGGKVDVYIYGTRIQETSDSFIYHDLSNTGDPTNIKNAFVLGQISADAGKTVTRKRLDNLKSSILPTQPVFNVIEMNGSRSGANFVEKSVDSLGRITGNYELIRDTGAYAGSPWAFDKIRFIKNKISDYSEDKTKSIFNGQDSLGFADVLKIGKITQNIIVTNENSRVVASDRSSIRLSHTPITNVTRVFNTTTGERYVVTNQNPDGSGTINQSGKITISGRSLPAVSDILQVDYTWVYTYDSYLDFDNRYLSSNVRTVGDSIDWGYSNLVRKEKCTLVSKGSILTATTTHPISSVIDVSVYSSISTSVALSSGRLCVVLPDTITNVLSVIRSSDGAELWSTTENDGAFNGLTAFLPTDTVAEYNDSVDVIYNTIDVYNTDTTGSFNSNTITIVPSSDATAGRIVLCNYIANISTLLPATLLPSLPALRSSNNFSITGNLSLGVQPTTHLYSSSSILFNLRQAPSNLGLNISGSISPGVITVTGTTVFAVNEVIHTVSSSGLKHDLSTILKKVLGLASSTSLSSSLKLYKIAKVSKVTTTSGLEVLSTDFEYDLHGYHLYDNSFVKNECVEDTSLKASEFTLPSTPDNSDNAPTIGDRLQITFYYSVTSDSENVFFSKSGTLFTNKRFALVDSVAISSGFTSSSSNSATLLITNMNQPIIKSRYKVYYDYLAPKVNERITIRYNFDRLITDATFNIEKTRPISADVLAKACVPILVDVTMKISVTEEFKDKNSANIVLQNVQDVVTASLNSNALAVKVDGSDLVNQAYTVTGVDSARVIYFNRNGKTGSVLSITSAKNEFLRANNVNIELET